MPRASSTIPAREPRRPSTATTSTPAARWETCIASARARTNPSGTRTSGRTSAAAQLPRWALTQNPLIYRNLVIVASQTPQASVVAYDKLTGELKWKSPALSGGAGYVSPSIVKVGGEDHLVMIMAAKGFGRSAGGGSVNGLDPLSGKVLWTYGNWQCGIPVPHAVDAGEGRVLITGGYSAGAAMIKVQKKGDGTYGVDRAVQERQLRRPHAAADSVQGPLLRSVHDQRAQRRPRLHDDGRPGQVEDGRRAAVQQGRCRSSPTVCCSALTATGRCI